MHQKRFIPHLLLFVSCKLRTRIEVAFVSIHVSDFSIGLLTKYFWVIFYCMRYLTCFLYFFLSHVTCISVSFSCTAILFDGAFHY